MTSHSTVAVAAAVAAADTAADAAADAPAATLKAEAPALVAAVTPEAVNSVAAGGGLPESAHEWGQRHQY